MKRKSRGQLMLESVSKAQRKGDTIEDDPAYTAPHTVSPPSVPQSQTHMQPQPQPSVSAPAPAIASNSNTEEDNNRHREFEYIKLFKSFDLTMSNLKSKSQTPFFTRIQENIQQLTGYSFTLHDACVIVMIFPEIYEFQWQSTTGSDNYSSGKVELQLLVACKDSTLKALSKNDPMLSHIGRVKEFSQRVEQLIPKFISEPETFDTKLRQLIPNKPDTLTTNKASNDIKPLARMAEEKRQKRLDDLKASLQSINETGLAGLKKFANQQGQLQTAMKAEEVSIDTMHLNRIICLPDLCVILRSLARAGKSNNTLRDLTKSLSMDMKLSEEELLQRLTLIAEQSPEFLTISQPDDIVIVETIHINLSASFSEVRNKFMTAANDASQKLKALRNA